MRGVTFHGRVAGHVRLSRDHVLSRPDMACDCRLLEWYGSSSLDRALSLPSDPSADIELFAVAIHLDRLASVHLRLSIGGSTIKPDLTNAIPSRALE